MLAAAVKLRLRYVVYTKANVNKREPKIVSRWGLSRKSVGGRGRLVIDIFVLVGRWLVALAGPGPRSRLELGMPLVA
jgi:hypothetical protein